MLSRSPFVVLLLLTASVSANDWPQWRGPKRDGIAVASFAGREPKVAWRANVGLGFASLVVADGRLFTIGYADDGEVVYCLDAATGKEQWRFAYPCARIANLYEGGPNSTPTVDGGQVFVVGKEGQFFCLDAARGTKVWEISLKKELGARTPDWGFASSPLILDGLVIVQANCTAAFNKKTGELAWRTDPFKQAYGSAIPFEFKGKTMIADLNSEALIIIDAATGKVQAKTEWRTSFDTSAATPIVVGDQVFISTGYGKGCGLFQFTGSALKQVYANGNMANHMNSCVNFDGHLYGIHGNSHQRGDCTFNCIDFATGEKKWAHKDKAIGCGAVALAGDKLIIIGDKGDLVIATASSKGFEEVSRLQAAVTGKCWTPPIVAHGRIFLRSAPGDVACVEVK
jgi:outer membrane protein assembly factor BamB